MAENFGIEKKQYKHGHSMWKKAVGVTLLVLLLSTGFASLALAETFNLILQWGSPGSGPGEFNGAYELDISGAGNVYVTDVNNHRIQEFDSNGNFINEWGSFGSGNGQFKNPIGIAIDSSGHVYVTDRANYRVQKFDSDGNYITQWGSFGNGEGQFNGVMGIAVDAAGYVYVTDIYNSYVQKFDSNGNFITRWGGYGSGDGQLSGPEGIAVDNAGYVYVADGHVASGENPQSNNRVSKFDSSGNFITKWGSYGYGEGQFINVDDIAIDASGFVYVVDSGNQLVQKFTSNGNFITKWGGSGQFAPGSIGIDSNGFIYIVIYPNTIEKYSVVTNQISLGSADIWVGLKNSDAIGIKLDLKAEVYKDSVLIGSGELDSVKGGSSGFNNANLNSIPLTTIGSPTLSSGDVLSIKVYERNAAVGSGKNSGTARLWFNDAQANSSFGITLNGVQSNYYLLNGFSLSTSQGSGPKATIDMAAGAKGSDFKLFGTWNLVMP